MAEDTLVIFCSISNSIVVLEIEEIRINLVFDNSQGTGITFPSDNHIAYEITSNS